MTFKAINHESGNHNFLGLKDVSVYRGMHLEAWRRDTPRRRFKRLVRDPRLLWDMPYLKWDDECLRWDDFDSVDALYNEKIDKLYHPTMVLPIHIEEVTNEQLLTKLGIKENKVILAKFSVPDLEEKNISPREIRPGDLIEYELHQYHISTVFDDPESHWLNSTYPFILICRVNDYDREEE